MAKHRPPNRDGLEEHGQVLDTLYRLSLLADVHRVWSYSGNFTRAFDIFSLKGYQEFPQLQSPAMAKNFVKLNEDFCMIRRPLLQEVKLDHFSMEEYFQVETNAFKFPWRQITHLTLVDFPLEDFTDISNIYADAGNLEYLCIIRGRFPDLSTSSWSWARTLYTRIAAEKLKRLTLFKCTTNFLLAFLSSLEAPRLTDLSINTDLNESSREPPIEDGLLEPNELGPRYFQTLCEVLERLDDRASIKTFMFCGAPEVARTPGFRLVELVRPLQRLQTLLLDDITPELAEYLTWESDDSLENPNLDHCPLPDLQLLICDDDSKTEQRDELISTALRNREHYRARRMLIP